MHETMVAQSLLMMISTEAAKQNAKPVVARISCGVFDAISDEVLCFAFEAIAEGTICDGVKLQIEHKPVRGHCKSCNQDFDVELGRMSRNFLSYSRCPKCGTEEFDLLPGAPLVLEDIQFQTERSDV